MPEAAKGPRLWLRGAAATVAVASPTRRSGSSGTMVDTNKAQDAALTIVDGLNKNSPGTCKQAPH